MVRPAQRRAVVGWARVAYQLPERRACRAVGVWRSVFRYRSVRPRHEALRQRMKELAAVRVRSGYRQLHIFLQREGWAVNQKRVYRLYTEEGLTLKRKRPKRHRSATVRLVRPTPSVPNEQWAMDFMHDTLAATQPIRVLTAIDLCTRECVALIACKRFSGSDVARLLSDAGSKRGGLPGRIRVDNGTEFTSKAFDHWAYWNQVQLDFSRPGKPGDNAFIESFNATVRRECLSQHWFVSLEDAQRTLDAFREDYNNTRPHRSLANQPPARFRAGGCFVPDRNRLQNLHP
jgi:putative transposase